MVERKRHLAKAVTYRFFGSLGTAGVAYVLSGNLQLSAQVWIADTIVKVGLYYVHERLWYRVRWGVQSDDSRPEGVATPTER